MKFNLKLDESLFDDDFESGLPLEDASVYEVDDDFSDYASEHSVENTLPGPAEGPDTGIASELIALINDEWEAIQGYNNAIAALRDLSDENPFYQSAIKVLEEISAEENVHVGQLQEVLQQISPNAAEIKKGNQEARSQMGLVGGLLPVQSWEQPAKSEVTNNSKTNMEDMCTLCDVDDEM